jgi:NDP-sugar pyrophosphorylase family protein
MKLPGQAVAMANGARVLMGQNVVVGENVTWQGINVIGDGCVIGDGVTICNSVLWKDTVVGRGSVIQDALLGSNCVLGEKVRIAPGAVINSGCEFADGMLVPANAKVFNSAGYSLQLEQG